MKIPAGWLRDRITLQVRSTGQGPDGAPLDSWTDVATVWASVTDLSGKEYIAAGEIRNAVQTKILIRYMAGIVPTMRVLHGASVYNVEAVLGQDHLSLMLMCSRVTS